MKILILRILSTPILILSNWKAFALLVGAVRLLWGLCPFCNSDAPALYDCPVCLHYHGPFPPSEKQKKAWKQTFWKWLYRPEHWSRSII